MKKDRKEGEMQRTLLRGILGLLLFFLLTGCGFNINSRIGPLLTLSISTNRSVLNRSIFPWMANALTLPCR